MPLVIYVPLLYKLYSQILILSHLHKTIQASRYLYCLVSRKQWNMALCISVPPFHSVIKYRSQARDLSHRIHGHGLAFNTFIRQGFCLPKTQSYATGPMVMDSHSAFFYQCASTQLNNRIQVTTQRLKPQDPQSWTGIQQIYKTRILLTKIIELSYRPQSHGSHSAHL